MTAVTVSRAKTPSMGRGLLRVLTRIFGQSRWAALLLVIALTGVRYVDPEPVELMRVNMVDIYQRLQPRQIPDEIKEQMPLVLIADIDEDSLADLGQWPWPRDVVAQLVVKLMEAGAIMVGFDIVFAEPDRLSPDKLAVTYDAVNKDLASQLRALPSTDKVLADVLAETRAVLGVAGSLMPLPKSAVPKAPATAIKGPDPREFITSYEGLVTNLALLDETAGGRGLFSVNPEADSVVRRIPAIARVDKQVYATLSVEMLRVAAQASTVLIRANDAIGGVQDIVLQGAGVPPIPTDPQGRLWPHYTKYVPERYISARKVLNGEIPPGTFENKWVLVGASATGLRDIRTTPIDKQVPGVEVHAQLLESMMTGSLLQRFEAADSLEVLMPMIAGIIIVALIGIFGPKAALAVFIVLVAAMFGGSWYLFSKQQLLLDASYASLATFIVYVFLTYTSYLREAAQRKQVRSAFSLYLAPAMVERLAHDPSLLKLGGEMRDMTLMFCDLRGFTTISEMYDAEGLTRLINRFLTPMTDIIQGRQGTIDKYIGDCIMAFWNAPLDDPEHKANSVRSSLQMREGMRLLNEELKAEAAANNTRYVPLAIGIGLNSGIVCVGNMGSEQRLNYSVLGDAVNLASRLEGQSKTYHLDLVVGETTYEGCQMLALLELDLIQVKGKTVPVRIFTCVGDEAVKADPDFQALKPAHDAMLAAYRSQRWDDARAALADCRKYSQKFNIDGLYDVYAERIDATEADPPGADWDGVFVAKTK